MQRPLDPSAEPAQFTLERAIDKLGLFFASPEKYLGDQPELLQRQAVMGFQPLIIRCSAIGVA